MIVVDDDDGPYDFVLFLKVTCEKNPDRKKTYKPDLSNYLTKFN